MLRVFRVSNDIFDDTSSLEAAIRKNIEAEEPDGIVLSSVVPSHTGLLCPVLKSLTAAEPLEVNASLDTGLVIDIPEPREIGADRIANAVAAYDKIGGDLAVVDLGSATTITVVTGEGRLTGGAIMPGIEMMCHSLNLQTGRLPLVRPSTPSGPLGKNTEDNISSGVLYGTAGAVERLLDDTEPVIGSFATILTGGNYNLLKGLIRREVTVIPNLTLDGLKILFERNSNHIEQ